MAEALRGEAGKQRTGEGILIRPNHLILTLQALAGAAIALSLWCFVMLLATADLWYVTTVFVAVSGVFLVTAALFEFLLTVSACLRFSPEQHLHKAWFLMAGAAGCRVTGWLVAHVFTVDSDLNPFRRQLFVESTIQPAVLQNAGIVFSSPLAFLLLGIGLVYVLRAYREVGWLASLHWTDYLIISIMSAQCVIHFRLVYVNLTQDPETVDLFRVLNWASEPLLLWLIVLACRLRRAADRMEGGWVARCWASYALAVLLTCLGDIGIWLVAYQYLQWPASFLADIIWIPAAAAFSLAPAYQCAAIWEADRAMVTTTEHSPEAAL